MNELTNSPPADDAPASRGAGAASTDMMGLLSSMVSGDQQDRRSACSSRALKYPAPREILGMGALLFAYGETIRMVAKSILVACPSPHKP